MVDDDGIAVKGALLVSVGGQLDGLDRAFFFGDDGPEVAVVAGYGKNQKGFHGAGIEVGKKDSRGVHGQARSCGVAVGRGVEKKDGSLA